jgi:hypothetical protein
MSRCSFGTNLEQENKNFAYERGFGNKAILSGNDGNIESVDKVKIRSKS